MSEPEIATKAPESDAAIIQPSPISSQDTRAQTGASMGSVLSDHCTTDRPTPTTAQQPSGEMTKFHDSIDVYVSKPPDYPSTPSRLLLLLTGGTGVHSTNNQLQADMFASQGFVVVMPDQFAGDSAPNSKPTDENDPAPSFIEQIKLRAAETAKSFMIDMWLARQTPEKVLPIVKKVLEQAKDEYADAVANGGGVYAVGYCFGARYVLLLAAAGGAEETASGKEDEEASVGTKKDKGPDIKAGAIAHATLVERDDLKSVRAPVSMICVENDPLFPDEILQDGRRFLTENHVEHEIEMYEGVPHGFAVVGEYESSTIKQAQSRAFDQMLRWLKSH